MRSFVISLLALTFIWNSVLGGVHGLVLCLHDEGGGHVELLETETAVTLVTDCERAETRLASKSCPPCVDVLLQSADLDLSRPNDAFELKVPSFAALAFAEVKPYEFFKPEVYASLGNPTRGPPAIEFLCELIRRTSVLRI
mgnify:CR=1 FL=1